MKPGNLQVSNEEYHALGGYSSSMLFGPQSFQTHPRLFRDLFITKTRKRKLVGHDALRGTIVDTLITEGGSVDHGSLHDDYYLYDGDGNVVSIVPPPFDRTTLGGKDAWTKWWVYLGLSEIGPAQRYVIGCDPEIEGSLEESPKMPYGRKRPPGIVDTKMFGGQVTKSHAAVAEAKELVEYLNTGDSWACRAARALLQPVDGVQQLSHQWVSEGAGGELSDLLDVRIRVDSVLNLGATGIPELGEGYGLVELKVTRFRSDPWREFQGHWGPRMALSEMGLAHSQGWGQLDGEFETTVPGYDWDLEWFLVCIYHDPTPEVVVHRVPPKRKELARETLAATLGRLAHCLATDKWASHLEDGMQSTGDPAAWEYRKYGGNE